jgi:hypothetical protein
MCVRIGTLDYGLKVAEFRHHCFDVDMGSFKEIVGPGLHRWVCIGFDHLPDVYDGLFDFCLVIHNDVVVNNEMQMSEGGARM